MKQYDFSEINEAENGQQIPSFTGTIKKVWDQISGEGAYGTWHLQNIILQDDHANEITVTWTCEDEWTAKDEGKQLLFESGYDKKEQLCGIKKDIRTKEGKRYESVKVDDRAKVKILDGGYASSAHSSDADKPETQAADSTPSKRLVDAPPARSNGHDGAKIAEYAAYSRKVFQAGWDEAEEAMKTLMPDKDAKELSFEVWYDLKMRIAQNISIEVSKIIRREKF